MPGTPHHHERCEVVPHGSLGEMLLSEGVITRAQLDESLAYQSAHGHQELLGEVLVSLEIATEAQVLEVLASSYGVPFAACISRIADPKVAEILPREFLEEHGVMPLFLVRGRLTVAVSEPANLYLLEEIHRLTGHEVQIVATTAREIESTLRSYLPAVNVFVIDDIYEDIDERDFSVIEKQVTELADLEEVAGRGPVVKLVNYIIFSAVQEGASDIHIEPGDRTLRIRTRIDGRLFERLTPPWRMSSAIASRIKIMSNLDISERRVPQDGDFHVMMEGRPIDLRVSTMPGKFGEKIAIRIIDSQHNRLSLEQIGFAPDMLRDWKSLISEPNGVILVTGPTGSGKSTTLYSVLSEINTENLNISTIEDPIEAQIPGINQSQVHDRAGYTFATSLRAMLRQDPDIMMVGEIRDAETAAIVTQGALTGHLVFSTLHTNDSPSAITRLCNLGIEPYLVAATLRGVLSQRLVRKICPHCTEPWTPTPITAEALRTTCGEFEALSRGAGCNRCRQTGFAGRIGIFELLVLDEAFLHGVTAGHSLQELRAGLEAQGFRTLHDDGMEKVAAGLTTPEEIVYVTRT